jgi:NDP-sugar pyrophosphorylase family protein
MEKFYLSEFFDLAETSLEELFANCQFPWEVLAKLPMFLEKASLGKILCPIPEGVTLVNPEKISIGKGTVVEPGAFIQGPCLIGDHCQIRHGAYIRGGVVTGDHVVIGHGTEIKSSILLNRASCAHFNYVGDSLLGNGVNLGAGVVLANLRLDHQAVRIVDGEEKIPTELKKLGAILGDGVQIGCNSVTNPGTILGKGVFCPPCQSIGGVVPSHAKLRSTHKLMVQDHVDRSCF